MTTTRQTRSFACWVEAGPVLYKVRGRLSLTEVHGSERLEHFGTVACRDHSELVEVEVEEWTATPLPLDNGHWNAIMAELEERRFDLAQP